MQDGLGKESPKNCLRKKRATHGSFPTPTLKEEEVERKMNSTIKSGGKGEERMKA